MQISKPISYPAEWDSKCLYISKGNSAIKYFTSAIDKRGNPVGALSNNALSEFLHTGVMFCSQIYQ